MQGKEKMKRKASALLLPPCALINMGRLLILCIVSLQIIFPCIDSFCFYSPPKYHRSSLKCQSFSHEKDTQTFDTFSKYSIDHTKTPGDPALCFSGGGIYFWWQAGALQYLQENYDLSKVRTLGASAGSLSAVLAACDVDMEKAFESAIRLCNEHNVWERPLGLAGVWGGMVEEWLDELLPPDAAEICTNRAHINILHLRGPLRRVRVSAYESKQDLIDCCMSSVHVPFFMDRKLYKKYRGRKTIDGSFLSKKEDFTFGNPSTELFISHQEDMKQGKVRKATSGDFLKLRNPNGVKEMMTRGKLHMKILKENKKLTLLSDTSI